MHEKGGGQESRSDNSPDTSKTPATSLVSKLALAYSTLPPEQRTASRLPGDDQPVSNPELDSAFQKLTAAFPAGHGSVCPDCGHPNPIEHGFCGICGAKLKESAAVLAAAGPKLPKLVSVPASREKAQSAVGAGTHADEQRRPPRDLRWVLLLLFFILLTLVIMQPWQPWRAQPLYAYWRSMLSSTHHAQPAAVYPQALPPQPPATSLPTVQSPTAPATMPPRLPPSATPVSAPQRINVPGAVELGRLVYGANPEYPRIARDARIQGKVVLRTIVGKDGSVQELKAIGGNPLLFRAAIDAVKKWRFRPYVDRGQPVEVETTVTVDFKLEE